MGEKNKLLNSEELSDKNPQTPTYKDALELATKAHTGQKRWNGEDYITHPIAVSNAFDDETHKIVAVMHDVIEDTNLDARKLNVLGYPVEIINVLNLLTRDKKRQSYLNYILEIKDWSKLATEVKIEDLKHNLSDLKNGSMRDKYLMALYILRRKDKGR